MKYRLYEQSNEIIDRTKEVSFQWNNKTLRGYAGDTLASALLAYGVKVFNYSFKYGRARGIFSSWVDEPNALINLEPRNNGGAYYVPNARATEVEIYDDLDASLPRGPSVFGIQVKQLFKLFHKAMPAGFYYKTFMAPRQLWHFYEKIIRKLAGVSPVPKVEDAELYDHYHQHCDILIVGGGVAGMQAALSAPAKQRVILLDDRCVLGGQWHTNVRSEIDGKNINEWIKEAQQKIHKASNITLLQRTTAYGRFDHGLVLALERLQDHLAIDARSKSKARQRLHRIRYAKLVIAAGAFERPIAFPGNDVPGIMISSAVQDYINRYGVMPGKRPLIYTNNDAAFELARDIVAINEGKNRGSAAGVGRTAGVESIVPVIVDARFDSKLPANLMDKVTLLSNHEITDTEVGAGGVTGVRIRNISNGEEMTQECDLIALSGGFDPVVHLSCHLGGKPEWNNELQCFLPQDDDAYYIGAVAGYWLGQDACDNANATMADISGSGDDMSAKAGKNAGKDTGKNNAMPKRTNFNITDKYYSIAGTSKQFVDFQNDVTKSDIELAIRENYKSIEHIKRYTAMGFGTDQGKTSNIIGMNIAADLLGLPVKDVGTTTYRPAYTPVTFGAMVGRNRDDLYDPKRYTPMHFNHVVETEQWETVGQWMRPWYFPKDDEDIHASVKREVTETRKSVAIMDASTLGKIDVQGPDAREFLGRVYPNAWKKLAVGKCRYSVMLDDNGMIFDDGVTACIGENHFLMTTTSGGAAHVYGWLEDWLQTEWPELKVYLTSVTDHWATTAVVGPNSRAVMSKLCNDVDFSKESFAFMDWKQGTVCGIAARIMRISFSGELAYEINVQANYGSYIWEKVREAGKEYDMGMYGTETMHVLRAEKGYIIAGQDTDGTMTPVDMDMEWIMAKKKEFSYLGKRALERPDMLREDRKQLVGLLTKDAKTILPEGCTLINSLQDNKENQGFVSSSYYSPALDRPIAFALVKGGKKRLGESIYGWTKEGKTIEAEISEYIFYDRKGERKDG